MKINQTRKINLLAFDASFQLDFDTFNSIHVWTMNFLIPIATYIYVKMYINRSETLIDNFLN